MKRSTMVDIIAGWGSSQILNDMYANNYKEWADNLLYTLENELGMKPPTYQMKPNIAVNGTPQPGRIVREWEPEDDSNYCGAV